MAFERYEKAFFDAYGMDYSDVIDWDRDYNAHTAQHLKRPIMFPPEHEIGGHCVVPGTKMLADRFPNQILSEVLKYGKVKDAFKAWHPCNIYPSAKIGKGVNVGMFTEIGPNVEIGDNARIGMGCFIPEGVTIGNDVFIGPNTIFANDRYPPSGKENWERTVVKDRARIGAGCMILPGITIGEDSLIGMGAVVTKDVPKGQTVKGNPAS